LSKRDPRRFFLWDFTYALKDPHIKRFNLFDSITDLKEVEKNFTKKYDKN